jgi:hypothetical protein
MNHPSAQEPPSFEVEGEVFDLSSMLQANADDEEFCEWLYTASIGDVFPAIVECRRVA